MTKVTLDLVKIARLLTLVFYGQLVVTALVALDVALHLLGGS